MRIIQRLLPSSIRRAKDPSPQASGSGRSSSQISRDQNQPGVNMDNESIPSGIRRQFRAFVGDSRRFVVDPEGETAFAWSALLSSAVMYNVWAVILRISFVEMRQQAVPVSFFLVLDFVVDILYIMDVFFQFRMGYLQDGILVKDWSKLADNYKKGRRGQFLLDMFAAVPFTNFVVLAMDAILRFRFDVKLNVDDIYPLLRLPKLIKWHILSYFIITWNMKTNSPNMYRACKLLVFLATTIHWIGCFYNMISEMEGLGSNDWVLQIPPPGSGSPFFRKYLRSMYWSTMTLTTIGETSSPHTNTEYIFTGCTFLTGVFLFATVVGNVGDVISNMNAARVAFQQKMDGIKLYMRYHDVPDDIQSRVKKWAEYSWNRTQAMDDFTTLDILPFRLRTEIAKHVHLETLQKVKIFEECEQGLLCELVVRLRSQIYSPRDYICRKGEIGKEMYIINHGKVEVLIPNALKPESSVVVATLTEGNFFGEISLLKLEDGCNRRNADVRSVGYSELLVLSKRDMDKALIEYPDARKALEKQARDRIEEIRSETLSVKNPYFVAESESVTGPTTDRRNISEGLRFRERELSELAYIVKELKSFDSQATKNKLEVLKRRCQSLEQEVNVKTDLLARTSNCPNCSEVTRQLQPRIGGQGNCHLYNDQQEQQGKGHGHWHVLAQAVKSGKRDLLSTRTKVKKKSSKKKPRSVRKKVTSVRKEGDTNNVLPTIINGCQRLYDCEDASTELLDSEENTIAVIVPQISINDEVYQELKVLKMPTPPWLRSCRAYSDDIPPLVYIEEEELQENNSPNEYEASAATLCDFKGQSSPGVDSSMNLFVPDVPNDCSSDVSEASSDSD